MPRSYYSTAHALAFVTDPFFYDMRQRLARIHGPAFVNLGFCSLTEQCLAALERIALVLEGDQGERSLYDRLSEQFMYFLSLNLHGTLLYKQRTYKPALIWATMADDVNLDSLAPFLVKVHTNPTGAVGGERNHKTNNRVRSKQRVRLSGSSCEKQVSVTYNSAQLKRVLAKKRDCAFVKTLAAIASGDVPEVEEEEEEEEVEEDFEDEEDDDFRLGDNVEEVLDPFLQSESDGEE